VEILICEVVVGIWCMRGTKRSICIFIGIFDWNCGRKLRKAGRSRKLHDSQLLRHLWGGAGCANQERFLVLRGDGTKGGGSPICGVFGKSGEILRVGGFVCKVEEVRCFTSHISPESS